MLPSWLRGVYSNVRLYAKEVGEDDLSGSAAELAFRVFLALFPFLIFLAALGNFTADLFGVEDPTDEVIDALGDSLPEDTAAVLRRQIDSVLENRNTGLLSIAFVGAVWAASGAVGTIMKAMNKVYDVKETRPIWKRYAIALSLTFFGGAFLLLGVVFLIVGEAYSSELADALGLSQTYTDILYLSRWPATIFVILIAAAVLYWAAPDERVPFRLISYGSSFFVAGWLIASFLFGIYVANFSSYNATYGALGTLVIALIWAYMTSFLLLAGAEINAIRLQRSRWLAPVSDSGEREPSENVPEPRRSAGRGVLAFATMFLAATFWLRLRRANEAKDRDRE